MYQFISLLVCIIMCLSCHSVVEEGVRLHEDYHVLGIQADPPVARPDDQVTLTVYDYHPTLNSLKYSWQVCLYSYGSITDFECLDPDLLIPIETESPRVTIPLGEDGLDVRKLFAAYKSIPDVNGETRDLTQGIYLYVILKSGDPKQILKRSIKRIKVIDAEEDIVLPSNPLIEQWTVEESEVVNINAPCTQQPQSSMTGIQGLERDDLASEMTSIDPCIVHAKAKLSVNVDFVQNAIEDSSPLDYVYTWYTNKEVYADPAVTSNALGIYKLPNSKGKIDLIFTVKTDEGGFAIAQQELIVVENKDSITNSTL